MQGIADFPAFVAAARGGDAALAGWLLGEWLLMAAAMIGVAALPAAHPLLFRALRYLGVAYLFCVGLADRAGRRRAAGAARRRSPPLPRGTADRTVTNPKSIVFSMAFLPLFVGPARHQGLPTFAAMAAALAALTLLCGTVLIAAGRSVAWRMGADSPGCRWLSRAAGVTLPGFGRRLATD